MNIKGKSALVSLFFCNFTYADSYLETALQDTFRVALIKNAAGYDDIKSGNYADGISSINKVTLRSSHNKYDQIENNMGLCVAHIKMDNLTQAEALCSEAVESFSKIARSSAHLRYLKSLAFSNRAIVRAKANQISMAQEDFTRAQSLSDNDIVKGNMQVLNSLLSGTVTHNDSLSMASE